MLKANNLAPMWDRNFAFGQGFHEQIRLFIAHAHVFMPVITKESDARKWVHQEIGYAMALRIPVLPIAVGHWPGEMLQQIHAISIAADRLGDLAETLTDDVVGRLIKTQSTAAALYTCADFPDTRARMLAEHAEDVLALGYHGMVRQKGGLSSFHIPVSTIGHKDWKVRYGKLPRSDEHCLGQRREHLVLGEHAKVAGCRLIINPTLKYKEYGSKARRCRLRCLREFLENTTDDRCQVALKPSMDHLESLTLVGDWFAAQARSAKVGKGYYQTTFTRYAPTVIEKLLEFDDEFTELVKGCPENSRRAAIEAIREEENRKR